MNRPSARTRTDFTDDADRFEIRRAQDSDRAHVVALVSEMFRADVSRRYEWLYRSNPHGVALSWLAFERASGDAVGVTSIFPRRVVVAGRERVGSIGGDCYIAPRARRRGLATVLHRASFAAMPGLGVDFMYGPPRPNNLGALIKAGSRDVTAFQRFTRPMTAEGFAGSLANALPAPLRKAGLTERIATRIARGPVRAFNRLSRASVGGRRLERVTAFDASFTELSARIAPMYPFACVRDADYLRWRYVDCAARTQVAYAMRDGDTLVGLVVLELGADVAVIVDVFVEPTPAHIDAALQLALDEVAKSGSRHTDISITPGSPIAQRLARRGFMGREGAVFQCVVRDDDAAAPTLRAASSWHFTDGDKDSDTVFSVEPE